MADRGTGKRLQYPRMNIGRTGTHQGAFKGVKGSDGIFLHCHPGKYVCLFLL